MEKRFELIASSEVLAPFRREFRQILNRAGWEKKTAEKILLAVDEALTNIIRHAYQGRPGKMTVSISASDDKIEIVLEDQGKKFDPTQVPSPELPRHRPGGLGIHFIRTIMDQMIYDDQNPAWNRLRLIKHKTKI
ncbi:MAG: ATP-binding protein [Candidatus Omnitrophota bacterium]